MARFRVSTIWELVAGFLLTVIGGVMTGLAASELVLIVGGCLALAGLLVFAFGSVHLAQAKGYTGGWQTVGLLGILGVIGLIALLLLPDREPRTPAVHPHWSAPPAGTSGSVSIDRCPACGRLVPRGEPCPECEARRTRPRSNAWDLRVIAAVVVALIAFGTNVSVGLAVMRPVLDDIRSDSAASEDALAKILVRNAMTAIESAFIDYRTFYLDPQTIQNIEPSIAFRLAPDHLLTLDGELTDVGAKASDNAVQYYGDDFCYSVATASRTGTIWGVFVDKTTEGGNWYLRRQGGKTTLGW